MGLAPYGEPKFVDKIRDNLIEIDDDGSVKLATDFFEFMTGIRMTSPKFHALFEGEPRKPETEISQKEMDELNLQNNRINSQSNYKISPQIGGKM